ncbi:homeobox protein Nkx-2.1 [Platysternon megacephalum]|uniref:Homeobox protein Nkx-2.1 n=1 Tax=Platysternon megacephalum TaxID=55544 RepID=A0A4D9ENE8_9SAUR|nr:homeobox protein Nkx-2.1 [Platysternon megacephalum]
MQLVKRNTEESVLGLTPTLLYFTSFQTTATCHFIPTVWVSSLLFVSHLYSQGQYKLRCWSSLTVKSLDCTAKKDTLKSEKSSGLPTSRDLERQLHALVYSYTAVWEALTTCY